MNIFVLDLDPQVCAELHVNRHCVKMILESGQLLSNAHHFVGGHGICKQTHFNHPCSIWARTSTDNYKWLAELAYALCGEYTHRYDKTHAWQDNIQWLRDNVPDLPQIGMTPFVQAMPDYCKVSGDAVAAYQKYYCCEKTHLGVWKYREIPKWYIPQEKEVEY